LKKGGWCYDHEKILIPVGSFVERGDRGATKAIPCQGEHFTKGWKNLGRKTNDGTQ